jgi:hypothetical protein
MFLHEVLSVVIGRVGSAGCCLPNGKTYHSGRISPNFSLYHSMYSVKTGTRKVLSSVGGSERARTRPPRYDKPLRSIQFGDKA